MRILLFIPCFTYGGAEKQASILARYLHSKSHDVEVWGFPSIDEKAPLLEELTGEGIRCRVLPQWPNLNWDFGRGGRLFSYARDRFCTWPNQLNNLERIVPVSTFDVVVPFTFFPCLVTVLLRGRLKVKKIFWNHRGGYDNAGIDYTDFLVRTIKNKNPVMLANTINGAKFLADTFQVPLAEVTTIYNVFADDEAMSCTASQRVYRVSSGEPINLLHVANLFKEKDIVTVVDAVAHLIASGFSCRLDVAGFSPDPDGGRKFREHVVSKGLGNVVTHHDAVGRETLLALLGKADIGILSSRSEGLSNSVMEYMYAALPVIGTDIPGMHELLGDNSERCLFPVGDFRRLAELIIAYARDPDLRRTLGEAGRLRILQVFNPDKLLPLWEEKIAAGLSN